MAKQYVPLTVELVDEGLFLQQINEDLAKLQRELVKFRETYTERAAGSKGKLTIELTVCAEPKEKDLFSLKSSTKLALPSRPAHTSMAFAGESQDEQPCLLVRASGSTGDSPRQTVLTTRDGRIVDPETGAAKEDNE